MTTGSLWTFMVYLAGDNNLSAAGEVDLAEMRTIGSSTEVNVVAQFDNAGQAGTTRYHIRRKGLGEQAASLGKTDSGSPEVLLDFVKWAVTAFPAQRYALVLWNHGNGWEPTEIDRIAAGVDAADYSAREAAERSSSPLGKVFFRSSVRRIMELPSRAERAICSDDGSGHSLDTVELGAVMAEIVKLTGKPIDLLGMDACLMSNLEVAYQVRDRVRYIVASEESEPNEGWPYDRVLRTLVNDPRLGTAELASKIVRAYIQSYARRRYSGDVTQSALDPSRIQQLTQPLDDLAGELSRSMAAVAGEVWAAQRKSVRFYHSTLWDIGDFCSELARMTSHAGVRSAAQRVVQALVSGAGQFVVAESHRGAGMMNCTGASIYLPALTRISPYYEELDFAKSHRWAGFLKAYAAA